MGSGSWRQLRRLGCGAGKVIARGCATGRGGRPRQEAVTGSRAREAGCGLDAGEVAAREDARWLARVAALARHWTRPAWRNLDASDRRRRPIGVQEARAPADVTYVYRNSTRSAAAFAAPGFPRRPPARAHVAQRSSAAQCRTRRPAPQRWVAATPTCCAPSRRPLPAATSPP